MALNKPKYTLWNNAMYALAGLKDLIEHESSFKLQVIAFMSLSIVAWVLPLDFVLQAILQVALFIPIMSEITNSAIERVVDLVTLEYHDLAKRAKDAGAALVFISLIATGTIWASVLYYGFIITGE